MKKIFCAVLALVFVLALSACSLTGNSAQGSSDTPTADSSQSVTDNETTNNSGKNTPITLTIGNAVLDAYLNDSKPAKSLISQLPLTVTLNDSDNDFCGDSLDIDYSESDVTSGYKNGDLVFWPPASNFVIFVSGEEKSSGTGDLVKLGHITASQDALDALSGTIDVTIALKENAGNETSEPSGSDNKTEEIRVKITVGDTELYATLEDNSTTKALVDKMPMTIPMMDLYSREMCYRYGANALPTDNLRSDGYEIGDIAYWPPAGSLVILYEQNGEQFERQQVGHIDSGVDIFKTTGDVDVTFEIVSD